MDKTVLFELFQTLVVALLVSGCALYCFFALAPAPWVRALKAALARLPLPPFVRSRLQSPATGGCGGCDGCAAPGKPRLRD